MTELGDLVDSVDPGDLVDSVDPGDGGDRNTGLWALLFPAQPRHS